MRQGNSSSSVENRNSNNSTHYVESIIIQNQSGQAGGKDGSAVHSFGFGQGGIDKGGDTGMSFGAHAFEQID